MLFIYFLRGKYYFYFGGHFITQNLDDILLLFANHVNFLSNLKVYVNADQIKTISRLVCLFGTAHFSNISISTNEI